MRCTELTAPLKNTEFYTGGGGGGGHGDDDEDEHYTLPRSERLLETIVTFFDTRSAAVRSVNSSTSIIKDVFDEASVFRFAV